jgi:hypothetical protein
MRTGKGFVVPAGGGKQVASPTPGRSFALKLLGHETAQSIKIGDEITVGGPGTCAFMPRDVPHAWKNTGAETGRVLFLYTPAEAGGYIEALADGPPMDHEERGKLLERHRWEIVGPNPL